MTPQHDPKNDAKAAPVPSEITDAELDTASGGFNPQPDPPKVANPFNPSLPPKVFGGFQHP